MILVQACGPTPEPTQVINTPPVVIVISINESETASGEITQHKTFNQCDSASSFKAEVRFSDTSGQENQQALILKATLGGEAGISELAKVTLEGAIEKHFSSSNSRSQGHQESVTIDIPSRTQQEYTIVWREIRRNGSIHYIENGETKTSNYSYQIGLELVSATGQDLQCPDQASDVVVPTPTNTPQLISTEAPEAVISNDTPNGSILEIGQSWRIDNLV